MGVDLTLMPVEDVRSNMGFSHTMLPLNRNRELFDEIMKVDQVLVPRYFNTYKATCEECRDSCYGNTQKDAYGEPVKMARVDDLLEAFRKQDGGGAKEHAAYCYLEALPEDTMIAMFWH